MSETMTDLQTLLDAHHNTRLLRMAFPENDGPQATLMVNRFVGTEYVSRDFAYTVELLSDDARIEREAIHGKLLCISLVQADGRLRPFTGRRRGVLRSRPAAMAGVYASAPQQPLVP
jgi:type VI secretion system secreted protein VgrG